jgi:hypothetical protein
MAFKAKISCYTKLAQNLHYVSTRQTNGSATLATRMTAETGRKISGSSLIKLLPKLDKVL